MTRLAVHIWTYAWLPDVPLPILIAAGIIGWLVVAAVAGGVIGRMVRRRDRQVPTESEPTRLRAAPECPTDPCPGIHTHRVQEDRHGG